jgi:hypothetical protein
MGEMDMWSGLFTGWFGWVGQLLAAIASLLSAIFGWSAV